MATMVRELLQRSTDLWWASDGIPPPWGRTYSPREQMAREEHLERFLASLAQEAERLPRTLPERQAAQERLTAAVVSLARAAFDFENRHLDLLTGAGFSQTASDFAQASRRFDPGLSGSAIYQAGRNALTMNSVQMLFGQPVQLTPAILGYSLLYPYSDNYLDDPTIPAVTKEAFNQRLAHRLAGEKIAPVDRRERAVYDLMGLIESQFERARYPQVFESLLAIHDAQDKSIRLLRGEASPYDVDVLGISLEKGGASVLADGYLVAGTLTAAQAEFLFGWGAFLQLVDDLQDVQQDSQDRLLTVFSQTAGRWPMDALTDRTWNFGCQVLGQLSCFDAPASALLQELLHWSAAQLIVDAAGRAALFYTRPYLQKVESHSPFRFPFVQKRRRKLARMHGRLMRLIETLATPGDGTIHESV